jgi:hypothetical protein
MKKMIALAVIGTIILLIVAVPAVLATVPVL